MIDRLSGVVLLQLLINKTYHWKEQN